MNYKKVLQDKIGFTEEDTTRATQFLAEQFGAIPYQHPYLNNLVVLDKRLWWVIPVFDDASVDIHQPSEFINYDVLHQIETLEAGMLIFRQFRDNRLCVYLLDDIDILNQNIKMGLSLNWNTIETHKRFSEVGILIGNEVIGFKKLRQLRSDIKNSYPHSIA